MNILMLAPDPGLRGPTPKHTPILVGALQDAGCAVTTLAWGRTTDRQQRLAKVLDRVRQIGLIRRTLRQGSFDMFVIKTAHDWATLARDLVLLIATLGRRPCTVLQFHGSWPPQHLGSEGHRLFRLATHLLLRLCDGGLVLSQEERRLWQDFHPRGAFLVVRNPFPPKVAVDRQPGDRAALHVPEDETPVLLFVGRLIEQKGVNELIAAVASVASRHRCHLLLLGEGPLRNDLAIDIQARGLENIVTFAGYVEGDTLDRAYRCADVFVLPSWSEGLSFAIMEAMHAGLPIVTSPIRGMADHLEAGVNALFAPPRDVEALTESLEQLVTDAALRRRMGAANRSKLAGFAPAPVAAEYLASLRALTCTRQGVESPMLAGNRTD